MQLFTATPTYPVHISHFDGEHFQAGERINASVDNDNGTCQR